MEKMYHVGFDDTHGAKYVILPGDPGRVEKIAQFLDEPHFYCQHREYTTWLGKVDGETVMVMSTGMGGPSTAIGVEECYKTGVRTFIRIGTTGGINLKVIGGDLVIANSAIRMEGTTREYMPIEFPAVADHDVTCALIQAAKNLGARWHVGTVQCKDAFYGQHEPDRLPVGHLQSMKPSFLPEVGVLEKGRHPLQRDGIRSALCCLRHTGGSPCRLHPECLLEPGTQKAWPARSRAAQYCPGLSGCCGGSPSAYSAG